MSDELQRIHVQHMLSVCSQVEALGADGGDEEMTAADERPLKRRKGGGSVTGAGVPEHHRSEAVPPAAAAADASVSHGLPAGRPDGRKSKAGLSASVREGWRRFAADLAVAERAAAAAEGRLRVCFRGGRACEGGPRGRLVAAGRGQPRARPLAHLYTAYVSLS